MGKKHQIRKKVKMSDISKCCFDCAKKYKDPEIPAYDGTCTVHEGICEICKETKPVTSARKLFGYHRFL